VAEFEAEASRIRIVASKAAEAKDFKDKELPIKKRNCKRFSRSVDVLNRSGITRKKHLR
jgi:hypothetical protein